MTIKKLLLPTIAAFSLAACNSATEQTAKENPAEEMALEQKKAEADKQTAENITTRCMSAKYDDLSPKLKYADKAPEDYVVYYKDQADKCMKGAMGQMFMFTYDKGVLTELANQVASAEITAIETKKDPVYPTVDAVQQTLKANRR